MKHSEKYVDRNHNRSEFFWCDLWARIPVITRLIGALVASWYPDKDKSEVVIWVNLWFKNLDKKPAKAHTKELKIDCIGALKIDTD